MSGASKIRTTRGKKDKQKRKEKQTEKDGDAGDTCIDCTKIENKKRKMCIDCTKKENELRGQRKRYYPPVTEVIVKNRLSILHGKRENVMGKCIEITDKRKRSMKLS